MIKSLKNNTNWESNMSAINFSNLLFILTFFVAITFNSFADQSNQEQTVKEVVDHTVIGLYKTVSEKQLDSLTNDQVLVLFNDKEKNLAT